MIHSIQYHSYHVKYFTQGNGERVIFLHGWPTNARLWQDQLDFLQTDYGVIALDWLGFGLSDKPVHFQYTFTRMKEILDLVLADALAEGEKITIVAHDIGGPPAILWAGENEDKMERLVLLNTVIYPFKTNLDALSELLLGIPLVNDLFVSQFGLKNVMKTNTRSGDNAIGRRIDDILGIDRKISSVVKRNTLVGPLKEGRRNEIHTIADKFKGLPIRKNLIIARKDPLCYAHIKKLSEENPGVPTHFIDNCGHYIAIDRPGELNNILLGILQEPK